MHKYTALYFGSFNPIHNGHIQIIEYCLEQKFIQELYAIVTPHNPHKMSNTLSDFKHRLNMVSLVANNFNNKFIPCDIELTLKQPNYTAQTIQKLQELSPEKHFLLILGSDNFIKLDSWKDNEIIKKLPLLIIPRLESNNVINKYKDKLVADFNNQEIYIANDFKPINISSTEIREKINKNENVNNFMPNYIVNYITQNQIYI